MDELRETWQRLAQVLALMAIVLMVGTFGYHVIARAPLFDCFYMTVITLATVGYGETITLDHAGRVFTVLLIMGGIGAMTYAFSTITSIIVEGQLSAAFRRRRMEKDIAALSGHYIVCGGSHAGRVITAELQRTSRPFVLIDRDPEEIKKIAERTPGHALLSVVGDATTDETLRAAGIERAAGVFAVLATDQDNAFVALGAKGLNPNVRVVSRQRELDVRQKLFRSGADNVVNPEYIGGLRMASEMIRPATVGFLDSMIRDTASVVRFEEVDVPEGSPFVGRKIREFKGAEEGNAPLLVAVLDPSTKKFEINPDPERAIKAGDALVMLGEVSKLSQMRERFSKRA
ncbi:MAG: potassium channel protein [Elusimicrobia bacterium]|nr:potassium channel protein [Elusimicrobiota bacterium]